MEAKKRRKEQAEKDKILFEKREEERIRNENKQLQ